MKQLLALLLLLPLLCSAQEKLFYSGIITTDSTLKKDDLFISARAWYNKTFNSSKDVIQIIDKETGDISGKGTFKYASNVFRGNDKTAGYINFSISIFVKEGKYKYEFSDFIHESINNYDSFGIITTEIDYPRHLSGNIKSWENNVWKDIKAQIEANTTLLIETLKESMTKKVNSNW